jgi:hypothetical protein
MVRSSGLRQWPQDFDFLNWCRILQFGKWNKGFNLIGFLERWDHGFADAYPRLPLRRLSCLRKGRSRVRGISNVCSDLLVQKLSQKEKNYPVYAFTFQNSMVNICTTSFYKSRDSAVGIATGYALDDQGVGVRVPVGSRIFSSPRRPDRLWGPLNLLSNG